MTNSNSEDEGDPSQELPSSDTREQVEEILLSTIINDVNVIGKCLVVEGLSLIANDDLRIIICKIGEFYDVSLKEEDFVRAYCILPKEATDGQLVVIVRFRESQVLDLLVDRSSKSKKRLLTGMLGLPGDRVVSLKNTLPSKLKHLLWLATHMFSCDYRSALSMDKQIFLQKEIVSPVVQEVTQISKQTVFKITQVHQKNEITTLSSETDVKEEKLPNDFETEEVPLFPELSERDDSPMKDNEIYETSSGEEKVVELMKDLSNEQVFQSSKVTVETLSPVKNSVNSSDDFSDVAERLLHDLVGDDVKEEFELSKESKRNKPEVNEESDVPKESYITTPVLEFEVKEVDSPILKTKRIHRPLKKLGPVPKGHMKHKKESMGVNEKKETENKTLSYEELVQTVYERELKIMVERLDLKSLDIVLPLEDDIKETTAPFKKRFTNFLARRIEERNQGSQNRLKVSQQNVKERKRKKKASVEKKSSDLSSEEDAALRAPSCNFSKRRRIKPKMMDEYVYYSTVAPKKILREKSKRRGSKRKKVSSSDASEEFSDLSWNEEKEEESDEDEIIKQATERRSKRNSTYYKAPEKTPSKIPQTKVSKKKAEAAVSEVVPKNSQLPNGSIIINNSLNEKSKVINKKRKNNVVSVEPKLNGVAQPLLLSPGITVGPNSDQVPLIKSIPLPTLGNNFKLISNFEQLIDQLKTKKLLDCYVERLLLRNYSGIQLYILMRCKNTDKDASKVVKFSEIQEKFALTVFLHAPKCYKFLSRIFSIPSANYLGKKLESWGGEPGFLMEVFKYIEVNVKSCIANRDFALIIDTVPLSKGVVWDPYKEQFSGYVESNHLLEPDRCLASQALIVMAVSVTGFIKLPIAYFFIDHVWPGMLARIVDLSISKMLDVGAKVWSVTLDASEASVNCINQLGCEFTESNDRCSYFHHQKSKCEIYILFDSFHLLKLARNLLAEKKWLKSTMGLVQWDFVKKIKEPISQVKNTTYCGVQKSSNIDMSYVSFDDTLAQTIESLRVKGDHEFLGSKPTVGFIKTLNTLCDITNSRNILSKGFKRPMNLSNIDTHVKQLRETRDFLKVLAYERVPLSLQKSLLIPGLLITINSFIILSRVLITRSSSIKYLCGCKFSLDQIDLFYSSLIKYKGLQKEPNTLQFKHGLKNLLYRSISNYSTHCYLSSSIVEFRSAKRSFQKSYWACREHENISFFTESLNRPGLKIYKDRILNIVTKKLVTNLCKKIICPFCIYMIKKNKAFDGREHSYSLPLWQWQRDLTELVERGGASDSVYRIISTCEDSLRVNKLTQTHASLDTLAHRIMLSTREKLLQAPSYPFLEYKHPVVEDVTQPLHESQLIDLICENYISFRFSLDSVFITSFDLKYNTA